MRNTFAVLALSSCLALTGCMSSLRIKPATDLKKPQGLLFYPRIGACKQQSVWLEYRYEISADKFGPVFLNQSDFVKVMPGFSEALDAQGLRNVMTQKGVSPISPYVSDDDPKAFDKPGNLVLGSNLADFTTVVDYSHPMWLNSGRPLAGTTQVSAKFNADGSLAEASAQVDNETLSTILTAVTSLTGSALGKLSAENKPLQVSVKVAARAHTHTKYILFNDLPVPSAKAPGTPNNNLQVGELNDLLAKCVAPVAGVTGGSWVITDALPPAEAKKADDKPAADKKP